jgi:prepilin-type N-terminal cleavage/methylation domain-containing protein
MNRRRFGFTLVELIVVISVIGILAAVTVVGFNRYQADSRDARRAASAATITEALEKYYDKNGEYPGCTILEQEASVITTDVLPGLQAETLIAPQTTGGLTNAIQCGETLTINGTDFFEYEGDGSTTCLTGDSCLSYSLKYKDEASGTIQSVDSRRQTSIATSTQPTVTVETIGASTVALTWTAVGNASGYKIQAATNSGFSAGLAESISSSTGTTVLNLNPTTLYYFRVAGMSGTSTGTWSSTVTATTLTVEPPVLNCSTVNSGTQMTITWPAVSGATSYTLQRSTSASFTSPTINTGITGTSQAATGLTTGTLYYYRALTVSGSASSAWSTTCSGGPVLAPTGIGSTSPTCGGATVTWTGSTGATSYNIEHSASGSFTSPTTSTGHTGTSGSVTGLPQGATRYLRVYAVLGSAISAASSSTNVAVGICPPASYTISGVNNSGTWTATSNAICAAGTTANYQWYANGSAWQSGDDKQVVGYALNYGQSVTLTVNTRCYNGTGTSTWAGASNSSAYTRPVPAPTLNGLSVQSNASGSNDRVNTSFSAVCGGLNEMLLQQGSYTDTSSNRFALPNNYGTSDSRLWYSTGTVLYRVRTQCNGVWSGWSNQQSAYVTS